MWTLKAEHGIEESGLREIKPNLIETLGILPVTTLAVRAPCFFRDQQKTPNPKPQTTEAQRVNETAFVRGRFLVGRCPQNPAAGFRVSPEPSRTNVLKP